MSLQAGAEGCRLVNMTTNNLCRCGHRRDLHYVEPLFLKGYAPCWSRLDEQGRLCECEVFEG